MSAARTSAVSPGGTSSAVTISSLAAQTTKIYNLLVVLLVFTILGILSMCICFGIWLKKRKTNKTLIGSERAIPLATLSALPNALPHTPPSSPKPIPPARNSNRPVMMPPLTSYAIQTRSTQPQRSQTAGPPLPLHQRPILPSSQIHGADYSSGRPRRYGSTHLSQSGPSVSANVHNSSVNETFRSKKMDKINNS